MTLWRLQRLLAALLAVTVVSLLDGRAWALTCGTGQSDRTVLMVSITNFPNQACMTGYNGKETGYLDSLTDAIMACSPPGTQITTNSVYSNIYYSNASNGFDKVAVQYQCSGSAPTCVSGTAATSIRSETTCREPQCTAKKGQETFFKTQFPDSYTGTLCGGNDCELRRVPGTCGTDLGASQSCNVDVKVGNEPWFLEYAYTGDSCDRQTSPLSSPPSVDAPAADPQESDVPNINGGCFVDDEGDLNCFDAAAAPGDCQTVPGGGVICYGGGRGNVAAPPAPNNGTPGTPATPTGTLYSPDTGTTGQAFPPSAVAGSSGGYSTGGMPPAPTTPGGGDGEGENSESDDSLSGGGNCDAPPTCTGSPIQCFNAKQLWTQACALSGAEDTDIHGGVDQGIEDGLGSGELEDEVDVTGVLPTPGASSCSMQDVHVTLFGSSIPIKLSFLCPLFVLLGQFLLIAASILGFKIVSGGVL